MYDSIESYDNLGLRMGLRLYTSTYAPHEKAIFVTCILAGRCIIRCVRTRKWLPLKIYFCRWILLSCFISDFGSFGSFFVASEGVRLLLVASEGVRLYWYPDFDDVSSLGKLQDFVCPHVLDQFIPPREIYASQQSDIRIPQTWWPPNNSIWVPTTTHMLNVDHHSPHKLETASFIYHHIRVLQ